MKRLLAATLLASASAGAFVTLTARDLPQVAAGGLAQTPPTLSREEIALAADRIRADRWYDAVTTSSAGQAVRQSRNADMELLLLALKQPFPELRAAAVREFGRFELAQNATLIASFLGDPVDLVQREAADALVQTLWDKSAADAAEAVEMLDLLSQQERSTGMVSAFWQAIAELPLEVQTAQKYEKRFIDQIRGATPLTLTAQSALLTLALHRRGRPLMAETERQVMEWARKGLEQGDYEVKVGTTILGSTIGFLEILQAAQADADDIAIRAATFYCRRVPPAGGICGVDIRLLGAELLNSSNPAHIPTLLTVARGRSYADIGAAEVAIRSLIKSTAVTRCQLLDLAQGTAAEIDVIAALADDPVERNGECGDWSPEFALTQKAQTLTGATRGTDWIAPAAALEALAKRAPDVARPLVKEFAAEHPLWQVRVCAARVAGRLKERDLALKLASDTHPNVRNAALEALRVSDSPKLAEAALAALSSSDYQLVRTAALVLKDTPDPMAALIPLFDALRRLTEEGRDTSRRARLALLERIGDLLPGGLPDSPGRRQALETLLRDFDPAVAKAAADLLQKSSSSPVEVRPTYRRAQQPAATVLRTLPTCVVVGLKGESYLFIVLNRRVAPVAVGRFFEAAMAGYYNNTMFYRGDENLAVFGNPALNDEGGWPRFARDEPGTRVGRLTVTMLNHGPDTADGRLAVRWRGDPDSDRRETVIGQGFFNRGGGGGIGLGEVIETIAVSGEKRLTTDSGIDLCDPRRPW